MKQKKSVFIQLLLISMILFVLTAFESIADDKKTSMEQVAIVNGTVITREELNHELNQVRQRMLQQGQEINDLQLNAIRTKVLENLINRELLYQESENKGIKVDPKTIDAQMISLRQRFPNEAEFKKALNELNLSEESIQNQIKRNIAIQELVNSLIVPKVKISEEENRTFYKDHPEYFKQPEQVKASHILIKLDPQADEAQQKQARKKIEEIQQKLKDGQDFAELAKNLSEGPSREKGGDLGYFSRGNMVKPFEDAAFTLKPGELSDIVQTQYGYHLILITDRKPEKIINYEDVENKIEQYLKQEKVRHEVELYVKKLKDSAEIKKFI